METQRIAVDPIPNSATTEPASGCLIPYSRPGAATLSLGEFFTIGRDPNCHLTLNDPFVSTRHARIEIKAGRYVLRDLQSTNGTYLNGSRVGEAVLTENDRVRFGESVYIFAEKNQERTSLSSKNSEWNTQLQRLPAFASTDFPVLITGPSGSGKEILARSIHHHSSRVRGPFVSINCSALSESLIESELFGHVRGSFTGATHDRKGAFECARGGTLFLDEVGDLPINLQPKLLRALENNEIRPVGADRSIETDVRIIAATHKDLIQHVRLQNFREDLYYRLNVCHLSPPSLNERHEDFDDLVYQFAKLFKVRFSFHAIERLKEHRWPGNIRELKNVVARASAYFPGKHIQPEDIDQLLGPTLPGPEIHYVTEPTLGTNGSVIKELEREMIIRRLIANGGNQRQTAKDLGLPKSTLHDRIKSYSIDLKQLAKSARA